VAEIQTTNGGSATPNKRSLEGAAAQHGDSAHSRASTEGKGGDQRRGSLGDAAYNCHSVQSVKGDEPASISIKVAPAPPPDEYPEIRAAVQAAQKEVKAGAKLKFASLYTLGQVIGTGHYARFVSEAAIYILCAAVGCAAAEQLRSCRVHCSSTAHQPALPVATRTACMMNGKC
jgi:hypothetical protein